MTIVAATGHRPEKLGGHDQKTRRALGALATEYLHYRRPAKVISGMALGWDQAVAAAAIVLNIPLIAAVPFPGQSGRWPADARARHQRLLEGASEVKVVTTSLDMSVTKAMQCRNEWMVDNADEMVALWDGSWGGTFNCVRYAEKRGTPVKNLWDKWTLHEDLMALLQ